MKNYFFFELAKSSDQNQLLKWRNEKKIRKASFNTKLIKVKEHKLWFKKSLKKKNIWIFKKKKQRIGMDRLETNKKKLELNYLIDPKFRGKKLGQKMLIYFIKNIRSKTRFQNIYAKSKLDNSTSFYTLLNSGFEIFKKKKNYYIFKYQK